MIVRRDRIVTYAENEVCEGRSRNIIRLRAADVGGRHRWDGKTCGTDGGGQQWTGVVAGVRGTGGVS
jgi:hypothetical protein